MNFDLKICNKCLTLEDQEEALNKPDWACIFARNFPNANIKLLQEAACKNPKWAYNFARDVPGADIQYCQQYACKDPGWAYSFAKYIPSADIKYCQNAIIKHVRSKKLQTLNKIFLLINFCSIDNTDKNLLIEIAINFVKQINYLIAFNCLSDAIYYFIIDNLNFIPEESQILLAQYVDKINSKFTSQKAIDKWQKSYNMRRACE